MVAAPCVAIRDCPSTFGWKDHGEGGTGGTSRRITLLAAGWALQISAPSNALVLSTNLKPALSASFWIVVFRCWISLSSQTMSPMWIVNWSGNANPNSSVTSSVQSLVGALERGYG